MTTEFHFCPNPDHHVFVTSAEVSFLTPRTAPTFREDTSPSKSCLYQGIATKLNSSQPKNGAGNPSFGEAKCVGFAFAIASLENKDVVEFHFKEDVFANERLLVFSDVSYRITIILKPGSIVQSSAVIRVENAQKTFCIGENAVIEGNVTFESVCLYTSFVSTQFADC